MKSTKVLVAVMDWGLGHATRSICIIRELLERECTVVIAGSDDSGSWLRNEFPFLPFIPLSPYSPVYPASSFMIVKLFLQVPKFIRTIKQEHRQIAQVVKDFNIDVVISDNRYGCWSRKVKSIFITHQVNLLPPSGFRWAAGLINFLHISQIKKFSDCWVPDLPGKNNLAGVLSRTDRMPVRYIGLLSRFNKVALGMKKYDLLIVLSGPEPQRTIFEKILVDQCAAFGGAICLVRGTKKMMEGREGVNIAIHDIANTKTLYTLYQSSSLVVARSGYSTIMDLACMGGRVIFVPTPGQTEQEYLAKKLENEGIAFSMKQDAFNLMEAVTKASQYTGFSGELYEGKMLEEALDELFRDIS